tara:strand:+ start:5775 stop:5933 length:159 start_codon:yes stop_codon:yes gene_type:complete
LKSLESEIAKASREIKCAEADLKKAQGRLTFALSGIHNLKDREDPADMKPKN